MEKLHNFGEQFITNLGNFLPGVVGALVILILGFIIAKIIRKLIVKLLKRTHIDEKIGGKLKTNFRVDRFIANLVYYIIIIYVLIIVLNILGVEDALAPLKDMLNKFFGYLPNIIAAGIIAFAGYILSSIGSEGVGFVSDRLESFSSKIGLNFGSLSLTKIIKQIVFALIFIPILIVALDTLKMKSISEPATQMLGNILNAIPLIVAAVLLLGIFYIVGKYLVSIVVELLKNLGVDNLSKSIGLENVLGEYSFSEIIGKIAMFFIVFTGVIAAADKLQLDEVKEILNTIFFISGKVFFGLIILIVGLLISNLASKALEGGNNAYMVPIVKLAIIGIFLAFSLSTMGIAENIVNLTFGLTLGAVAVAFALSFGLGGREAAGKQMEDFFQKLRDKRQKKDH